MIETVLNLLKEIKTSSTAIISALLSLLWSIVSYFFQNKEATFSMFMNQLLPNFPMFISRFVVSFIVLSSISIFCEWIKAYFANRNIKRNEREADGEALFDIMDKFDYWELVVVKAILDNDNIAIPIPDDPLKLPNLFKPWIFIHKNHRTVQKDKKMISVVDINFTNDIYSKYKCHVDETKKLNHTVPYSFDES